MNTDKPGIPKSIIEQAEERKKQIAEKLGVKNHPEKKIIPGTEKSINEISEGGLTENITTDELKNDIIVEAVDDNDTEPVVEAEEKSDLEAEVKSDLEAEEKSDLEAEEKSDLEAEEEAVADIIENTLEAIESNKEPVKDLKEEKEHNIKEIIPVTGKEAINETVKTVIKVTEKISGSDKDSSGESTPENNVTDLNKPKAITDFDAHLFNSGTFYKVYEKFGAQITNENNFKGVRFTTWAPNANGISVIGEFNGWNDSSNQMKKVHDSGIWSVFIPGLKEGDTYKFSVNSSVDGFNRRKIDPYAFRSEMRPKNACVVHNINKYKWNDSLWMDSRTEKSAFKDKPLNIYELHLGSWKRNYNNTEFPNEWGYLSYGQLAHEIVDYVKKMGYTHVEVMPVMEHPLDISWGYQVTHYFAPSSRFGDPEGFMYFVDHCHQNGIGVILDWVPAHFPADEHSLAYYDGKQIYAYEDWKKGFHKDWNTYIFDYGRPQVQIFLISSALFWLEKYHADGLRVDAVASMLYLDYSREKGEWEPNIHGGRENLEAIEFLKHLNDIVHNYHPGVMMIAEESTAWPGVTHPLSEGGLGFDMKWNMGWMNDILLYFSKDPVHRKYHQGKITFSLWYAFSENFILPVSHDEVVHGKKSLLEKMPGDTWQKFANLRLFLGFMSGHPGKKLNFMTTDIGQYKEWYSEVSLEWNLIKEVELNRTLNLYVKDLNNIYLTHPALFEVDSDSAGFQWMDFSDALSSVISFCRFSKNRDEIILFTFNMTPTVRNNYNIGVPEAGYWKEIFNSDAEIYGGSGLGNMGGKHSEPVAVKNWENSISLTLPPLAVNVYKLEK